MTSENHLYHQIQEVFFTRLLELLESISSKAEYFQLTDSSTANLAQSLTELPQSSEWKKKDYFRFEMRHFLPGKEMLCWRVKVTQKSLHIHAFRQSGLSSATQQINQTFFFFTADRNSCRFTQEGDIEQDFFQKLSNLLSVIPPDYLQISVAMNEEPKEDVPYVKVPAEVVTASLGLIRTILKNKEIVKLTKNQIFDLKKGQQLLKKLPASPGDESLYISLLFDNSKNPKSDLRRQVIYSLSLNERFFTLHVENKVNQAFWVHVNYWFEFRCFVYKAPEKNEFTSLGRFDISKMLNDLLNGVKKASQELKYDVRYND